MIVDQDLFRAALLDPAQPVPDGLVDGTARPAGRRYNVYRNNVAVSLTEALREGFPVITKLLGQQNMDGLSGLFLRAHPPQSPVMMFYGAEFPAFIADMPQLAHLGYLADVARIELGLRRAYHAAGVPPIDPQALASLPPEGLLTTTFTFAPALQLIRSDWPIHAIWRFNSEAAAPKPEAGAQDVLILRPEFDPYPHLLPPGGAALITALINAHTLGAALDAATAEAPGFDLTPLLALLLDGGALTSLNQKDTAL